MVVQPHVLRDIYSQLHNWPTMSGHPNRDTMTSAEVEQLLRQLPEMKVPELKFMCKHVGLQVKGRKQDLIARIEQHTRATLMAGNSVRLLAIKFMVLKVMNHDPVPEFQSIVQAVQTGFVDYNQLANLLTQFQRGGLPPEARHRALNGSHNAGVVGRPQPASVPLAYRPPMLIFHNTIFYRLWKLARGFPRFLEASKGRHVLNFNCHLAADEVQMLRLRSSMKLYLFSGLSSTKDTNNADIMFPPIEFHVNGVHTKQYVKGLKGKAGTCRPADLTPYVHDYNKPFDVTIVYSDAAEPYALYLYVVESRTPEQLVTSITTEKAHIPAEATKRDISKEYSNGDDDDIVMATSSISLRCPITYARMTYPMKSTLCEHIQCFDGLSFLTMQERIPSWICPVCSKEIKEHLLAVSDYLADILRDTSEDVDTVTLNPDGSWTSVVEAAEISDDDEKTATPRERQPTADDSIEIISLGSESEDEQEPPAPEQHTIQDISMATEEHEQPAHHASDAELDEDAALIEDALNKEAQSSDDEPINTYSRRQIRIADDDTMDDTNERQASAPPQQALTSSETTAPLTTASPSNAQATQVAPSESVPPASTEKLTSTQTDEVNGGALSSTETPLAALNTEKRPEPKKVTLPPLRFLPTEASPKRSKLLANKDVSIINAIQEQFSRPTSPLAANGVSSSPQESHLQLPRPTHVSVAGMTDSDLTASSETTNRVAVDMNLRRENNLSEPAPTTNQENASMSTVSPQSLSESGTLTSPQNGTSSAETPLNVIPNPYRGVALSLASRLPELPSQQKASGSIPQNMPSSELNNRPFSPLNMTFPKAGERFEEQHSKQASRGSHSLTSLLSRPNFAGTNQILMIRPPSGQTTVSEAREGSDRYLAMIRDSSQRIHAYTKNPASGFPVRPAYGRELSGSPASAGSESVRQNTLGEWQRNWSASGRQLPPPPGRVADSGERSTSLPSVSTLTSRVDQTERPSSIAVAQAPRDPLPETTSEQLTSPAETESVEQAKNGQTLQVQSVATPQRPDSSTSLAEVANQRKASASDASGARYSRSAFELGERERPTVRGILGIELSRNALHPSLKESSPASREAVPEPASAPASSAPKGYLPIDNRIQDMSLHTPGKKRTNSALSASERTWNKRLSNQAPKSKFDPSEINLSQIIELDD